MAIKEINTRIQNKLDSFHNWSTAGIKLLPGEIALVQVTETKADKAGNVVQVPAILMKIGEATSNGDLKTFEELPWLSAKAADVYDWAKKASPDQISVEVTTNNVTKADTLSNWLAASSVNYTNLNTDVQGVRAQIAANGANIAAQAQELNEISQNIGGMTFQGPAEVTATSFIDTITQTKGKVSATRKELPTASVNNPGIVQLNTDGGACAYETFLNFSQSYGTDLISQLSVIASDYVRVSNNNKLYLGTTGTEEIVFDCGGYEDI